MAEEQNMQESAETTEEPKQEFSSVELKAMEMGWKPKDEFVGEEDSFIPADEFVRRKPLFDKIESQSKEIKSVHRALEALKTHFSSVREAEYTRALKALKAERRNALANGEADKFEELDDEIKTVEQEAQKLKETDIAPIEQENTPHPEFAMWTNRNPWYTSVGYMRKFADEYGLQLARQGTPPSEVLKAVEAAVKKEFPNKFRNPNKENAPFVEASSTTSNKGTERFELNAQERKIMNDLVRGGVLTEKEYIEQLKSVKGIK